MTIAVATLHVSTTNIVRMNFSTLFRPEAAISVSRCETVRDELEETKNVSGNMIIITAYVLYGKGR